MNERVERDALASERAHTAPGWVRGEDGSFRRETIHRMGRRSKNWDYRGKGTYLITIAAAKRGAGVFGRVCAEPLAAPGGLTRVCAEPLAARFKPNALGEIIERAWGELKENWPRITLLESQIMEDHFHGVLASSGFLEKPLGAIIGSFKARSSSAAGFPLWATGYVDTILFDDEAKRKAIEYVRDNPRRLAIKRANPALFKVLRELTIGGIGRFSAIGNEFLLKAPIIFQVQCSRRDFAYARGPKGELLKSEPPRVKTAAFDEKRAELLAEVENGAVVISPAISEGERELARVAYDAGARVITLSNKGFSPLYKPGGRYFEACADGRLLMLAPINWPYEPGEKKITRASACALNRIAQLIAKAGAARIDYKGVKVADVDRLVEEAVR